MIPGQLGMMPRTNICLLILALNCQIWPKKWPNETQTEYLCIHCKPFHCKNCRFSLCPNSHCTFTVLFAVTECMQWITALADCRQVLHCIFYYFSTAIFTTFPLQFLLLFYCIFSRKNVVDQPGIEPGTFSMEISRSTNWSMKTWLRI